MKKGFILYLSLFLSIQLHSQVVINEIMQSNIDCIMDDLNDFPDSWIELYNTIGSPQSLGDYKVGKSPNANDAWQLPTQSIYPHQYAVVYCDKVASGMHTSFRIDTGKKSKVYLFKNDIIIDSVCIEKKQPAPNVAYGRINDGSDIWGYMEKPTPYAANCGSICKGVLGEPVFSQKGGVFKNIKSFKLSITLPEDAPEGTQIRVSYDMSEPTEYSPLYSGDFTISTTRVIRAKLFCEGYISPRSTTHSYIFFPREMTLPVISIVTNNDYFFNNNKGIYVDGSYNSTKKNYEYNWRRPINIEMFTKPDENSVLNQLCETRVAGAASRGFKLKSLALYAHKRFGNSRFLYEFFPDQRPGQTNYNSIVLRNAGNDFDYLYMRDAIFQRSMANYVDLDWQAWRPAIIYINGTYKGILNIRERANEKNIFTNYNELEDIDLIENWYSVKEGSDENLNNFKTFYNEHGHTWNEYDKWMDLNEFINFMIMNVYYNNIDFPANNFIMWRPRTENGKWRFIAKDTEYGMGIYGQQAYNYKYFNWFYYNDYDSSCKWGNTYETTRLFRRLMEDNDFNREFIDHMAVYMGDFLNYDRIWTNTWKPMYDIIKTEYPNHRKLINEYWPVYSNELSSAQTWLKNRTNFMYQHLADYYSLGSPISLTINSSLTETEKENIKIIFNGIPLTKETFNGKFFKSREINLSSELKENATQTVTGWDVVQTNTDGTISTIHINIPEYSFYMPNCKNLEINATLGTFDSIEEYQITSNDNTSEVQDYYDSRGIQHNNLRKGMNIVRFKNGTTKKVWYQ